MPGKTQDSLMKYHVPQDIYTVQSSPDAARVRQMQAAGMANKDTLRSQQSRLEKDIFNRLSNYKIGNDAVLLIVQVGKYAFLAIMLPPYLFFYGIPKWLLLEALPALSKQLARGGQFIIKGLFDLLQTVSSPFKKAYNRLKQLKKKLDARLNALAEQIRSYFSKIGETLRKGADRFYQTLKTFTPKNGLNKLADLKENITSKMKELFSNSWKGITKAFEKAAHPVKQLATRINERMNKAADAVENAIEKAEEWMAKLTKPVADAIHGAFEGIAERLQTATNALTQPVIAWILPKIEAAQDKITYSIEAFKEKMAALQQMLANIVSPIKQIPGALLNLLASPKQFVAQLGEKIGLAIAKMYRTLKEMLAFIPRLAHMLKDRVGRLVNQLKEWKNKGQAYAKKGAMWVLQKAKRVPQKAFQLIKKLLKIIQTVLAWVFYCLRVLVAWITVLLRFGMLQVYRHGQFITKK